MEKKIDFEQALKKLEEITEKLEKGNLTLDESLKFFEEGIRLSRFCEKKLSDVENRIKILQSTDIPEEEAKEEIKEEKNQDKEEKKEKKKKKEIEEIQEGILPF